MNRSVDTPLINKPNDLPAISVIINCYNSSKYLREAIDSVYSQTEKDWEIIFWDNASTDNSGDIAKSYGEKIRYFRGEKTIPLYTARNFALKQARGKYIAFLDCDDMWLPNKLEFQKKEFQKKQNTKLGLIYTNVNILEYDGSVRTKYKKTQPSGRIFRQLLGKYIINLQTVMISKEVLNEEDYWFDESMLFSGDADLFLRVARKWDILYLPRVTARYREHGGSLSATRIESLLKENEKIIDNLSRANDEFIHDYRDEIEKFRQNATLSVFIAKWKYAGGIEARKFIANNLSSAHWLGLFYILTFLPFKVVNSIRTRLPV